MSLENLSHGDTPENQSSSSHPERGRLRNRFGLENSGLESPTQEIDARLNSLRGELAALSTPSDGQQNPLVFSTDRFTSLISLPPEARQQQFSSNINGLRNLTGDVRLVLRNPLARAGEIVLDIIRFPINPIDNTRHLKESAKNLARHVPFIKNLNILQETPEEQSISLSTNPQKAEQQMTTSLLQMRRDALPYDGGNPLIDWIVNKYAKKNINMSAAQALAWFAAGNIPAIGFMISAGKLYLPNVVEPFYERKFLRSAKTLILTATDFAANIGLSVKAGLMIHDAWELFATRGVIGGALGVPLFLLNNWEIITPYPVLLAYNPLFIQGRLDKNDYRKYARHMEGMAKMLWDGPSHQKAQVTQAVQGMLTDYAQSHKENSLEENAANLVSLMQSEYAALIERLTDETNAIAALQQKLADMPQTHQARMQHKIENEITELSLRNKAHKARLLFIENIYLLMKETGHN